MTDRVLAGRYRVDGLIGRGGMATVHRGYDLKLDRVVAVKILDPEHARDNAFRTRFRLEAQSASRMAHPSIVRVFDAGEDTERVDGVNRVIPFIVMEIVEGRVLKDIIADVVLVSDDDVKRTIKRLALRNKIVTEGAGALATTAALNTPAAQRGKSVAIVTGGSVDPDFLASILTDPALD